MVSDTLVGTPAAPRLVGGHDLRSTRTADAVNAQPAPQGPMAIAADGGSSMAAGLVVQAPQVLSEGQTAQLSTAQQNDKQRGPTPAQYRA